MNPEFPSNNPRAELEARLTAFVLGELPAHEAAALQQALDEDMELAALYEQLRTTIKLVREATENPVEATKGAPAPPRLSEERRQKLLAQFKTVTPKEFVPAKKKRKPGIGILELAAVLVILGLLAGLGLPALTGTRHEGDTLSVNSKLRPREKNVSTSWETATSPRSQMNVAKLAADGHLEVLPPGEALKMMRNDLATRAPSNQSGYFGRASTFNGTPPAPVASANIPSSASTTIVLPPAQGVADAPPATAYTRSAGTGRSTSGYYDNGLDWNIGDANGRVAAGGGSGTGQNANAEDKTEMVFSLKHANAKEAASQLGQLFPDKINNGSSVGGESDSSKRIPIEYGKASDISGALTALGPPPADSSQATLNTDGTIDHTFAGTVNPVVGTRTFANSAGSADKTEPSAQLNFVDVNGTFDDTTASRPGGAGGKAQLETRTYRVDPNAMRQAVANAGIVAEQYAETPDSAYNKPDGVGITFVTKSTNANLSDDVGRLYDVAGVDLKSDIGKGIAYNDRTGMLTVRGTPEDLEKVGEVNKALNEKPPEVDIKTGFAQVTQNDNRALGFNWNTGALNGSGKGPIASGGVTSSRDGSSSDKSTVNPQGVFPGTLSSPEFTAENGKSIVKQHINEGLSSLEVTTESGRQPTVKYFDDVNGQAAATYGKGPFDGYVLIDGNPVPFTKQGGRSTPVEVTNYWDLGKLGVPDQTTIALSDGKPMGKSEWAGGYGVDGGDIPANGAVFKQAYVDLKASSDVNDSVAANGASQPVNVLHHNSLKIGNEAESGKQSQAYLDKKQELDRLIAAREAMAMAAAEKNVEEKMPTTLMVEVIEHADAKPEQNPTLRQRVSEALTGNVTKTARIKPQRDVTDVPGISGQPASFAIYDPHFVQTEFEAIQSEKILDQVIERLKLNEAWAAKKGAGTPLKTSETRRLLRNSLQVSAKPNTSLVDISVTSSDPEEAAKIANTIADVYRGYRKAERLALIEGGMKVSRDGLAAEDKQIAQAKAELAQLDILHGSGSPRNDQTEYEREQKLLEQLKGMNKEEQRKALPTLRPDAILSQLLADEAVSKEKLMRLEKDLGPDHPDVQRMEKLIAEYDKQVDSRMRGIIKGLEIQVAHFEEVKSKAAAATVADAPLARPAAPAPAWIPLPEVVTSNNAFSTFSLNVADVSFKLAAASLEKGKMPEPASIRSEEFINAFDYRDPEPAAGAPLGFAWERARYPFAQNRDLLRFSVKTAAAGREPGRPMNIVLLLDKSGSMERADRVQIIHEALRVLATQLQPQDKLSVVTFARVARLWVDGLPGNQAGEVADGLDKLTPEGGTNLEEAMRLAYETARRHYLANGINRVVLLTDGAANLGDVDPAALNQKVEQHRKEGIALDCFGVGWEGYNDDLLEVLSRHGDGRYGFINTPEEAANGFAKQLAGALHVAAADVKVQVEFNPKRVTAYRQIGYAKHQLTKEQFRDNKVDAAEIGAAESGNALYVVEVNPNGEGPLATVHVRYRVPGTQDYPEHEWPVPYTGNVPALDQSSPAMRLAGTACAFSEWLANPYAGVRITGRIPRPVGVLVPADQLLGLMRGVPETYGADERPKKLEWMIRQAKSLERR